MLAHGEGPVCGSHNPRARKNSRNYMRSPRRRKPAHERSQSMVTRQRPSRSSSTAARLWCAPGPPGGEDVAQGDASPVIAVPAGRAVQRRFVPRLRQGPTPGEDARDSRTAGGNSAPSADGDTRLLRRGGKTRKCGPRTPRGAPSLSWARAVPQADETFGSPHSF